MEDIQSKQIEFVDQEFRKIDIRGKILSAKKFFDCTFIGCNFSEVQLITCKFSDCEFEDCNFSGTKVSGSAFRGVKFKNCKIIGVNWTSASWPKVHLSHPVEFDGCILNSSVFSGLYLQEIKMEGCQVHDVDFSEADCEYASFIQSDFHNSIYNKTNLRNADFTDAMNYNIDVFNNRITGAKFSLPEASRLLDSLDIEIIE